MKQKRRGSYLESALPFYIDLKLFLCRLCVCRPGMSPTANLTLSTLSVTTSLIAVFLTCTPLQTLLQTFLLG